MVNKKNKLIFVLFMCIFLLFIYKLVSYDKYKDFKYDYILPNEINFLTFISEKTILIESKKNICSYNLENNSIIDTFTTLNEDSVIKKADSFNFGIVWVETDINSSLNSIYLKYFDSNETILLDSGVNEIIPYIDIEKNVLVYYIADENLEINCINLLTLKKENIKTYSHDYLEDSLFISKPKTDGSNIIWSETTSIGVSIYIYSIKNKLLDKMNLDSNIYSPIICKETIIAIKENEYFDNELNIQYASDYIMEYNCKNKKWKKFEEERIGEYIGYPRECVSNIFFENNIFYWSSTLTAGNTLYDLKNNKFITLTTKNLKYKVSILNVKNNNIYYEFANNDEVVKFIYNYREK